MPLLNTRLFKFSKKPAPTKALELWKARHRRLVVILLLLFLCAGLITPYRYNIQEQGIVVPETQITLENKSPGILTKVYVKPGQKVLPGDKLLELKNPDIEVQVSLAQIEFEQLKLQLLQMKANPSWDNHAQAVAIQEALKSAESILQQSTTKKENLIIRATIEGRILTPNLDKHIGNFIPEATPLIKIGNTRQLKLLIPIPEHSIQNIKEGDPISGTWSATGDHLLGAITHIPPQKASFPNDYYEAIYARFGGPAPKQQFQSIEEAALLSYPIYIVEASIKSHTEGYRPDMRAQIKIKGQRTLFILRIKEILSQRLS